MQIKKALYLFLALLLPVCVFLFLRSFGKNEFAVKPLYVDELPPTLEGCNPNNKKPYVLPDSIVTKYSNAKDSLTVIFFGTLKGEAANQFRRVQEELAGQGVSTIAVPDTTNNSKTMRCTFFLQEPIDVVMFDRYGTIRGNYAGSDRDEIDRLLTEITIIQKRY
jgi:hypothetical protein